MCSLTRSYAPFLHRLAACSTIAMTTSCYQEVVTGVTEAVQKEPPPCRRYSQGHQVAKTLCTILRRGKREALFNVCRKYTNSRSEANLIPHKFTAYCIL